MRPGGCDLLGFTPDLQHAHVRCALADRVVDHERDRRVDPDVAVLGRALQVEADDVDRGKIGVVAESDRLVLRAATRGYRGQAAAALPVQVSHVDLVEWHESLLNRADSTTLGGGGRMLVLARLS